MLEAEPRLFYITDHYRPWPMLLARLSALDSQTLKSLVMARIGEVKARAAKKRTKKRATKIPKKKKARG
jgi:hypothetical protein